MSADMKEFPLIERLRPRLVAAFLRASIRAGWTRVRGALVPNAQAAVFSALAWVICRYGLGQTSPIFAPIATYLCMGFTRNRRPRKVIELGIGATIGALAGELFTSAVGFGWWQLLVLLAVVPLIGRMIDNSDLLTLQTGINAIVVASMSLYPGVAQLDGGWGRWIDALIGSLVALVATAILPSSLTSRPRRHASEALLAIADAVDSVEQTLRTGDPDVAAEGFAQLVVAREQISEGTVAHTSATDTAALNPALRGVRPELAELDRQLQLAGRLHISVQMLARQSRAMIRESGAQPEVAGYARRATLCLRHLSAAIAKWNKPVLARQEAETLAHELAPNEIAADDDWRAATLVSLLRACVVDLLQLTGLSLAQARAQLADTRVADDEPGVPPGLGLVAEHGSDMWGTLSFPKIDPDASPPDTTSR